MTKSNLKNKIGTSIFENTPCLVAALTPDFRIQLANPAFNSTFGSHEGDYCYKVYKGLAAPCEHCNAAKTFSNKTGCVSNEQGTSANGKAISYQVKTVPLFNKDGEVEYVLQLSLDTTNLEGLQQALRQTEQLANVGLTTAGLAHNIKNTLAGLEGGIYVVNSGLEKNDAERITSGWQMVLKYIEQVSVLVKNLLQYSKAQKPQREMTTPLALTNRAIKLFESKASLVNIQLEEDVKKN
ncbi:MAG: PAS domain-containing protein, partial [Pseudomonadota bacterium]